jgi:hypothetical protein
MIIIILFVILFCSSLNVFPYCNYPEDCNAGATCDTSRSGLCACTGGYSGIRCEYNIPGGPYGCGNPTFNFQCCMTVAGANCIDYTVNTIPHGTVTLAQTAAAAYVGWIEELQTPTGVKLGFWSKPYHPSGHGNRDFVFDIDSAGDWSSAFVEFAGPGYGCNLYSGGPRPYLYRYKIENPGTPANSPCIAPGKLTYGKCAPTFNGQNVGLCEYPGICNGILGNESTVCNGHGTCSGITNTCTCQSNYFGSACELYLGNGPFNCGNPTLTFKCCADPNEYDCEYYERPTAPYGALGHGSIQEYHDNAGALWIEYWDTPFEPIAHGNRDFLLGISNSNEWSTNFVDARLGQQYGCQRFGNGARSYLHSFRIQNPTISAYAPCNTSNSQESGECTPTFNNQNVGFCESYGTCNGIRGNESSVCSGHGTCSSFSNQCSCVYGYNGQNCESTFSSGPYGCGNPIFTFTCCVDAEATTCVEYNRMTVTGGAPFFNALRGIDETLRIEYWDMPYAPATHGNADFILGISSASEWSTDFIDPRLGMAYGCQRLRADANAYLSRYKINNLDVTGDRTTCQDPVDSTLGICESTFFGHNAGFCKSYGMCNGIAGNVFGVCSGHGTCNGYFDTCDCVSGYTGIDCEYEITNGPFGCGNPSFTFRCCSDVSGATNCLNYDYSTLPRSLVDGIMNYGWIDISTPGAMKLKYWSTAFDAYSHSTHDFLLGITPTGEWSTDFISPNPIANTQYGCSRFSNGARPYLQRYSIRNPTIGSNLTCIAPGQSTTGTCTATFSGQNVGFCEYNGTCNGIQGNETHVCSGHGTCGSLSNRCLCTQGYSGVNCETYMPIGPHGCNNPTFTFQCCMDSQGNNCEVYVRETRPFGAYSNSAHYGWINEIGSLPNLQIEYWDEPYSATLHPNADFRLEMTSTLEWSTGFIDPRTGPSYGCRRFGDGSRSFLTRFMIHNTATSTICKSPNKPTYGTCTPTFNGANVGFCRYNCGQISWNSLPGDGCVAMSQCNHTFTTPTTGVCLIGCGGIYDKRIDHDFCRNSSAKGICGPSNTCQYNVYESTCDISIGGKLLRSSYYDTVLGCVWIVNGTKSISPIDHPSCGPNSFVDDGVCRYYSCNGSPPQLPGTILPNYCITSKYGITVTGSCNAGGICLWNWNCSGTRALNDSACSAHGACVSQNTCTCVTGYTGPLCASTTCNGVSATSTAVCSGNGKCVGYNTCDCDRGYLGITCDEWKCFGVSSRGNSACNGRGVCKGGDLCACSAGFSGTQCETELVSLNGLIFVALALIAILGILAVITVIFCCFLPRKAPVGKYNRRLMANARKYNKLI